MSGIFDEEWNNLVHDVLWQVRNLAAQMDSIKAQFDPLDTQETLASVDTRLGKLEEDHKVLSKLERTHSMQIHAHVENLAQEIKDCEMLLAAHGLEDRQGSRDSPTTVAVDKFEEHGRLINCLIQQWRETGTAVLQSREDADEAARERRGLAVEVYRLRAERSDHDVDDLLCQLSKDVFVKLPEALAGHELLLAEATSRAAEAAGGLRPLAAADLLGRMLSCEAQSRQASAVAAQLPGLDDAMHDLQKRVVADISGATQRLSAAELLQVRLVDRLRDAETGLAEAAKRMGTVSVGLLGRHVEALSMQVAGLEARVPSEGDSLHVNVMKDLKELSGKLSAIESRLGGLVGMEQLCRLLPGTVATGIAQAMPLMLPDLVRELVPAITAEVLAALPRRFATAPEHEEELGQGEGFKDENGKAEEEEEGEEGDDGIAWAHYRIQDLK